MTTNHTQIQTKDIILAVVTAAVFSYFTTKLSFYFGFFVLFLALFAGMGLASLIKLITAGWRLPKLYWAVSLAVLAGGIPVAVSVYLNKFRYAALFQLAYIFLTTLFTHIRLAEIQITVE